MINIIVYIYIQYTRVKMSLLKRRVDLIDIRGWPSPYRSSFSLQVAVGTRYCAHSDCVDVCVCDIKDCVYNFSPSQCCIINYICHSGYSEGK